MGPKTFDKALAYVRKVTELKWSNSHLSARVQGTEPHPYSVNIFVLRDVAPGTCACPV